MNLAQIKTRPLGQLRLWWNGPASTRWMKDNQAQQETITIWWLSML